MALPGDVAAAGGEALPERAGVRARGLHPHAGSVGGEEVRPRSALLFACSEGVPEGSLTPPQRHSSFCFK